MAGKNILIVDDAAFMRMMIKDILSKNGYNVVGEAENGAKAVEKYNELTVFSYFSTLIDELKMSLYNTKNVKLFEIADRIYLFYCSEKLNVNILKNYKNFDIVKKLTKIGVDVNISLVEISNTNDIVEICKKNNLKTGVDNGKQV